MEICKNKKSGKYFVYIRETEYNKALLITPDGDMKNLSLELFSDIEEHPEELQENSKINKIQFKTYQFYKEKKSDEEYENVEIIFEQMSEHKRKSFIKKMLEDMKNNKNA